MISVSAKTTGGKKLDAIARRLGKGGISQIHVGYVQEKRYPNSTVTVAEAAVRNEFGSESGASRLPSRPFMRNANERIKRELPNQLKRHVSARRGGLLQRLEAEEMARWMRRVYRDSIDTIRPNPAPATLAQRESESTRALRDTDLLRDSVGSEVIGG